MATQGSIFGEDVFDPKLKDTLFDPFSKDEPKRKKLPRDHQKKVIVDVVAQPIEGEIMAGDKQVIRGNIPSKSNCYRIVTFKPKKDAPKQWVHCEDCDGSGVMECPECIGNGHPRGWLDINCKIHCRNCAHQEGLVSCKNCSGVGKKAIDPKSHYTLAKTKELKDYEASFEAQCRLYRNKMIPGEFSIQVYVFYPSMRPDLDNCLKILLDCLQKVRAFKNDNRCMDIHAKKFVDKKNPRVEFVLKSI